VTVTIMPSECCVTLCTNRGSHLFPWRDQKRGNAWMIAIKWAAAKYDGDEWQEPIRSNWNEL